MRLFTKEEVLVIHRKLIDRYGGIVGFDEHSLEVCLFQPLQTFDGSDLYPDDMHKICIVSYLIIKKHPFKNANKRTALLAMHLFLTKNGYESAIAFEDGLDKTIEIATYQGDFELLKEQVVFFLKENNRVTKR